MECARPLKQLINMLIMLSPFNLSGHWPPSEYIRLSMLHSAQHLCRTSIPDLRTDIRCPPSTVPVCRMNGTAPGQQGGPPASPQMPPTVVSLRTLHCRHSRMVRGRLPAYTPHHVRTHQAAPLPHHASLPRQLHRGSQPLLQHGSQRGLRRDDLADDIGIVLHECTQADGVSEDGLNGSVEVWGGGVK